MGIAQIKITDTVKQYSTYEDGEAVCREVQKFLPLAETVAVSFENIAGVPSSFVNGMLNGLIEEIGIDGIKQKIRITHSTRIINDMLRRKFQLSS